MSNKKHVFKEITAKEQVINSQCTVKGHSTKL